MKRSEDVVILLNALNDVEIGIREVKSLIGVIYEGYFSRAEKEGCLYNFDTYSDLMSLGVEAIHRLEEGIRKSMEKYEEKGE